MKQIPIERYSYVGASVANPTSHAYVPIEEWRSIRLNLMFMLSNEFNEYYKEVEEFLEENENFDVEKDIGFIDEYPLSIEYIEPNVHDTPPHWQYLISCGGPGTEIRFFVNNKNSTEPYKAEFWLLDWSTTTKHDVTSEDVIESLWEQILFPLAEQMETQTGLTSSSKRFTYSETQESDPLLTLAGTLERDVRKIKRQFKNSVHPTARVVKGTYADDPDPLIALLGTLECNVTDIGKRHDDYIGDALLAELWRDEDE